MSSDRLAHRVIVDRVQSKRSRTRRLALGALLLVPRLRERRTSQAGYTSGGEQQMLAIGRALMTGPELVLLDEPSMGLAPQVVDEIFEIVSELNRASGVSFLIAEQNAALGEHAHHAFVIEDGRVEA